MEIVFFPSEAFIVFSKEKFIVTVFGSYKTTSQKKPIK